VVCRTNCPSLSCKSTEGRPDLPAVAHNINSKMELNRDRVGYEAGPHTDTVGRCRLTPGSSQARDVRRTSSELATRRMFWAIRQSSCSYGFSKPNAMSDKVFCRIRMGVWAKWL